MHVNNNNNSSTSQIIPDLDLGVGWPTTIIRLECLEAKIHSKACFKDR